MSDLYDWSRTPGDNASADSSINWAEGQAPSTVNGSARAMMARVAELRSDIAPTRSTSGTGNAYLVNSNAGGSGALRDGEIVTFILDRSNTSASTLNVNSRGAKPLRPEIGREFAAGELRASAPIQAYYRAASDEWLVIGSGYHVNAMTSGVLTQSVVGRLLKVGSPVLSMAPTAAPGFIRLTQITQTLNKSDWPELNSWLAGLAYPWGSAATTFDLPPAAGYFLRFAGTSSAIDPGGPRAAGSIQGDSIASHTHDFTGTTGMAGAHSHTVQGASPFSGGSTGLTLAVVGTQTTSSAPDHTHAFSGTTDPTGAATETRARNVAFHVDIFSSSALAVGTLGAFGYAYAWDSGTTAADPGAGRVRGNHATISSVTALYINETDAWSVGLSGVFGTFTVGTLLRLTKIGSPSHSVTFQVTGAITDSGVFRSIPCVVLAGGGSALSNNDSLALEIVAIPGADGEDGAPGPQGSGTMAAGPAGTLQYSNSGTMAGVANTAVNGSTGVITKLAAVGENQRFFDLINTANIWPLTGLAGAIAAPAFFTEAIARFDGVNSGAPATDAFGTAAGSPNVTWTLGWNFQSGGGRLDTTKPAFGFTLEYNYFTAIPRGMIRGVEGHWKLQNAVNGNEHRPISFWAPWDGGTGSHIGINMDEIYFAKFDAGLADANRIHFDFRNTNFTQINFVQQTLLQFPVNSVAWGQQKNAAGSNFLQLPYFNTQDALTWATPMSVYPHKTDVNGALFTLGSQFNLAANNIGIFLSSGVAAGASVNPIKAVTNTTGTAESTFWNLGGGNSVFSVWVGSTGDAFFHCNVNGGGKWSFGLRNSADDSFILAQDNGLGGNHALRIDRTTYRVDLYGPLRLKSYTVATLPSASASGGGAMAYATDANAVTARSTAAGGGANKVLVFSDGTNWLIAA